MPAEPAQIASTIRAHGAGVDLVVVGGGDGTLGSAAGAVFETGRPMGIIPLGTANDLARTLQLPDDPVAACRVIAGGRIRRIDLGRINRRYFINAASIGIGVRVAHRLSHRLKSRVGVLAFVPALLAALREQHPFQAEIVCDGITRQVRTIQLTIGNGRHYGAGLTVAEEAGLEDGLLFLYSIPPATPLRLLAESPGLLRGRHRRRLLLSGRRIQITTPTPMPIDTDGEVTESTPADLEVIPAALPVFVAGDYVTEGNHAA